MYEISNTDLANHQFQGITRRTNNSIFLELRYIPREIKKKGKNISRLLHYN